MTTRRRFLFYVTTALAAVGVFAGDAAQAGKPPSLKLTVSVTPTTIIEGSTGTGTVTHNNSDLSNPVTVTLKSSDTTEATVESTVTIPSGTNTMNFAVTAIDDGIKDGPQSVTITTTATGYASASATVTVTDAKLLPLVRYMLSFPQMPVDATGFAWINGSNSWSEVVGWYQRTDGGAHAFVYSGGRVLDLNDPDGDGIAIEGIPDGWVVYSGVDINDAGVVVGTLANNIDGNRRPFAIDLRAEKAVLDLLPDFGAAHAVGVQINDYGQILGYFQSPTGDLKYYIFDPGLYAGDPDVRTARDGVIQDMSGDSDFAELLPLTNAHAAGYVFLNNPVQGRPAQVAGDFGYVPFRYTIGSGSPEVFPEITLSNSGLSGFTDSGTFYGVSESVTTATKGRKTQTFREPFRFGTIFAPLPSPSYSPAMIDVNSTGDLLYAPYDGWTARSIYRDDWYSAYGIVSIDDLLIGDNADLFMWANGRAAVSEISDRSDFTGAGQICGNLYDVFPSGIFFVLSPVPVP